MLMLNWRRSKGCGVCVITVAVGGGWVYVTTVAVGGGCSLLSVSVGLLELSLFVEQRLSVQLGVEGSCECGSASGVYAVFPCGTTAVINRVTRLEGRAALLFEWRGQGMGWGKGAYCGLAGVFLVLLGSGGGGIVIAYAV